MHLATLLFAGFVDGGGGRNPHLDRRLDAQGPPRDVVWAEFLDAEHLATSSRAGKVAVWKYPEIEPLYTLSLGDGAVPALSRDRKWIAYCNGSEVGLFDVAKRETIAQQAVPKS